ncbi:transposase-like protein%2C IS1239 [Streptococcus pneumoniae]|nr:transposase-like protein%2C IS1239 [Streptococcus pneumoniae]
MVEIPTLQQVRKGLYKKVYSADYAQTVYQFNRKRSVKKLILTKEIREKILHYHKHISKNFRLK